MNGEQLAVIRDAAYGIVDDRAPSTPKLGFSVEMLGGGAEVILDHDASQKVIAEAGVADVRRLDGWTCVVSKDGNEVHFVRLHRPAGG